ncbi:hypothetical protein HPB47_020073 [Ixodes persulcatus]|uniref:Uncharacterized protein n=1 Tax=Ixodes persulcatus TaxID=34615 RepID=A0AC60QGF8_IXOPE|nr:hypothetical protein HPB47_020073 [Ixodes persulcatus]
MAKCARSATVSAFLWLLALCPHRTAAQFDGNLTLQSSFGQLSAARKSRSLIQCWSSDSPARISFDKPGGLPRYSQQLLQGDEAHVLLLPASAGASRAGLFTCQQAVGGIVTSAATLKLPPSGKAQILPVKAYVVAHTGDNVQLSVTKQLRRSEPLVWMLEGLELPDFGDRETVTLEDVEPADAGVYECFYRGQRKALLHAWIRLIVYGPACQQDCPPCRNGGICHDTWGVCICPAGFAGPNCDTACGENRVGAQCERTCSPPGQLASARHGCAIHLFCKPDPLGCSCAPGFKGPHCSQGCPEDYYGADCLQKCRCSSPSDCDAITGHCLQGCAPGWGGDSCQIYVGEQTETAQPAVTTEPTCEPGRFGKDCSRLCHCADDEACDPSSGVCPASCKDGYSRPTCSVCLPGRFGDNCSLSCHCWNGHENCGPDGHCHDGCAPGWTGEYCQEECSEDTFGPDCAYTCHCATNSTPPCNPISGACGTCEPGYRGPSCQETLGGDLYKATAPLSDTLKDGMRTFRCRARNEYGFDVGTVQVDVVADPVLTAPPEVEVSSDHAEISWQPWSWGPKSGGRQGDTIQYQLQYRTEGAKNWTIAGPWQDATTFNMSGLLPNTEYVFAVALRRNNASTAELPRPETWATARTLCGEASPQSAPQDLEVESVSEDQLSVRWKPPRQDQLHCQLTGYEVHLRKTGDSEDLARVQNLEAEAQSAKFNKLEPHMPYSVNVYPVTFLGRGPFNSSVEARTEQGATDPVLTTPPEVQVSSDHAEISWEPWSWGPKSGGRQGDTIHYQLQYRIEGASNWTVAGPWQDATTFNVSGLLPDTEYVFAVALRRNNVSTAGLPEPEMWASARTLCGEASSQSAPQDLEVESVSEDRLSVRWKTPRQDQLRCKLTGYEIHLRKAEDSEDLAEVQNVEADKQSAEFDKLEPDTLYRVNVYPVTSQGRVPFNSSVDATTEQGVPGPVADLTVAWVNSSEALVTWQPPKVCNGTPVEFKVKLHPRDVGGCGVTGLEDVFLVRYPQFLGKGLAPHSLYRVGVSAGTNKGYGEQRELSFLTTGAAPSGPPRNIKVIWAGPRSLFLSWEPVPCREMHGPLVFYECTFKFADGTGNALVTNATDPNVTLHGLQPFRKYAMRVRAVNAFGSGPLSLPVMRTTTQDRKPEQFRVEQVTDTTVQLHWEEPREPNGVLVEYEVLVEGSDEDGLWPGAKTTVLADDDRTATLEDLSPGQSYKALVRALTIAGPGPYAVSHFTTAPAGVKYEDVEVSYVSGGPFSATLQLTFPEDLELSYYEVVLSKQEPGSHAAASYPVAKVHVVTNSTTEYFVVGDGLYYGGFFNAPLIPSTGYKAVVLAVFENSRGSEPVRLASKPLIFTTGEAPVRLDIRSVSVYLSLWILVPVAIALSLVVITTTVLVLLLRRQEFDVTLHDPVFDEPVMRADSSACSSDEEPPKPLADYEASPNVPRIDWQTFQSTYM